ncbi:MAG: calcium-binding protein [Betaproteobacteria bacterium]
MAVSKIGKKINETSAQLWSGSAGADEYVATSGITQIRGGGDDDVLTGNARSNTFIFEASYALNGTDTLTNFKVYDPASTIQDTLDLSLVLSKSLRINGSNVNGFVWVQDGALYIDPTGQHNSSDVWAYIESVKTGSVLNIRTGSYDGKVTAAGDYVDPNSGGNQIVMSTTPQTHLYPDPLSFNYRGTISGITLTCDTAGTIKLGGIEISTPAINGSVTLGGDGGVQTTAAQGVFTVTSGNTVGTDSTGKIYALGTSGADNLTGQYVWGYGGYNTITGTDGSDWLVGGADGNRLSGGKGADNLYGGSGLDTFTISSANSDTGNVAGGIYYGTTDCVFYFTTAQDKLALDIAGTSTNVAVVNGIGVGNEVGALNAAIAALNGTVRYVFEYNVTNSGNSWLYYFPDGTANQHTIIELVGLNSSSQFKYSDIIALGGYATDDYTNFRNNSDSIGYGAFSSVVSSFVKSGTGNIETPNDIDYFTFTSSLSYSELHKFTSSDAVTISVYDGNGTLQTVDFGDWYNLAGNTTYYVQVTGVATTSYTVNATLIDI